VARFLAIEVVEMVRENLIKNVGLENARKMVAEDLKIKAGEKEHQQGGG
jgi:DNA-binding protein